MGVQSGLLDSFELDLHRSPQNCSCVANPTRDSRPKENLLSWERGKSVQHAHLCIYRANSENRLRMYARSRTDMWKIVRNCVPFLSLSFSRKTTILILTTFLLISQWDNRTRFCTKERKNSLWKKEGDQVHVTACPPLDARTARVSRRNSFVSFLAKPFGIEVKAREKRNYVYLRLDRLVIKKNRGNREGFSSTFLAFLLSNEIGSFISIE